MNWRPMHILLRAGGVLICLAVAEGWAQSPAENGIGVFTAAQGNATVDHDDPSGATTIKLHDSVLFRDIIETQKESRTKALFNDDSLLTVGENSRVEITEHIYDPSQNTRSLVVKLVQGKLRALVGKVFEGSGSKFEIHTPTAVAAARGTYFVVWVEGNASGVVNIGQTGRVDFTSAGQTVSLNPGQFSLAPAGSAPTTPAVTAVTGVAAVGVPSNVSAAIIGTVLQSTPKPESPKEIFAKVTPKSERRKGLLGKTVARGQGKGGGQGNRGDQGQVQGGDQSQSGGQGRGNQGQGGGQGQGKQLSSRGGGGSRSSGGGGVGQGLSGSGRFTPPGIISKAAGAPIGETAFSSSGAGSGGGVGGGSSVSGGSSGGSSSAGGGNRLGNRAGKGGGRR